jgi:hypothetical protein
MTTISILYSLLSILFVNWNTKAVYFPLSHKLSTSTMALVALSTCSLLVITFPWSKRSSTPPVWYKYLLSIPELPLLSGRLLCLELVNAPSELLNMEIHEEKCYLEQASELT